MPCTMGTKKRLKELRETATDGDESNTIQKTKHACIVEPHESTRKRLGSTLPKDHEEHIAEKGYNSKSHCNLVHKLIPKPQAMKILDVSLILVHFSSLHTCTLHSSCCGFAGALSLKPSINKSLSRFILDWFVFGTGCEGSSGQGMEEARNICSMAIGQNEEQKRCFWNHKKRQKESQLRFNDRHLSSQQCGVGSKVPKVLRTSRGPR